MPKQQTLNVWSSIMLTGGVAILGAFRYRLASHAEAISEVMVLLLILTSWLVPTRFRPGVWKVIILALSVTMLLMARTTHGTATVVFRVVWAIAAICSLVQAFRELSKLVGVKVGERDR
jgi:hypothetical protein